MTGYPIEPVLDELGIKYHPNKMGNQPIVCPNPDHDDAHPSASLNLGKGLFNCLACGEGGSVVDLLMLVEGIELREAIQRAEKMDARHGGEVLPGGSGERSPLGLPRGPRYRNKPKGSVSPWSGFRT